MKKAIFNLSCMFLLVFFLINILTHSQIVYIAINSAFSIWKENLFPFLFPMFVISELLVSYGLIEILSTLGKPICKNLFKVKSEASYVLIMSLLTGFPSSAKYISQLHSNGILNGKEATKILLFTHFSNPLFIIGTIATIFLNRPSLAPLILIAHYLPNIIIGILFRNYFPSKDKTNAYSFSNTFNKISQKTNKTFGSILGTAIINAMNTLLLILGTISIFLVITTILNNFINMGPTGNTIINGFIEMSQGLKYVSLLDIPIKLKLTLSVIFISFGGFSVHLQTMAILNNIKVRYLPFLLVRILHAILSAFLVYLLFPLFVN